MALLTQKQVEWLAQAAGYGDYWEGYVMDKDLARCDTCRLWGDSEEVFQTENDQYCDDHRPEEE